MARGLYTVSFAATASASALDWFELVSPSTMGIFLHGLIIGQTTELGDTAEEQINFTITRGVGSVTSGSGGSSPTPATVTQTDGAASFTAEVVNTTQMVVGTGTLTILHRDTFNVRSGLQMWWPPECRPMVVGGARLAIGMVAAPTDSITWVGTAYVEEC